MKNLLIAAFIISGFAFAKAQTVDAELLQQLKRDNGVGTAEVIGTPIEGTIIYDDNSDSIYYRNTTQWVRLLSTNDLTASAPTLTLNKQIIGYAFAAAQTAADGTNNYNINCSITKPALTTGRYTVAFTSPHPNGANYPITLGVQEDLINRDGRIIQVVTGTQNANGFEVYIGTGDNAGDPDIYVDDVWYFNATAEIEVVVGATIDSTPSGPVFSDTTPIGTEDSVQAFLALNNFADNTSPFILNFRNTTAADVNWEVLLSNVPYSSIPGLANDTYSSNTSDNGDGTFNYLFTSTAPLGALQSLVITGNNVTPEGNSLGGTATAPTIIQFYTR